MNLINEIEDITAFGEELKRISLAARDLKTRVLYNNRAENHFEYARHLRALIAKERKKKNEPLDKIRSQKRG